MNDETEDTTEEPQTDELWVLYNQSDSDKSRLAIGKILDTTEGGYHSESYQVRIFYDSYSDLESISPPFDMDDVPREALYTEIPDEYVDDTFTEGLDHIISYVGINEAVEILSGDNTLAAGREGREAVRFWILDGISDSITEYSVGHGHGPSRYASAVEKRLEEAPACFHADILASEKQRWDGGFELSDDAACKIVEILQLKEQYLDEYHDDEIREIVNEYNLAYDEYIDGHFTAHDCPDCGAELIERPEDDYDYIHLDCSDCDSSFEGIFDDMALVIERRLEDDQ